MTNDARRRAEERAVASAVLAAYADDVVLELRQVGIRLYASPDDPEADYHLSWDGVDWQLMEGPVPLPPGPRHWWRVVRMMAFRYGVRLPITPPIEAEQRWAEDMAAGWYVQHHLLADMGMEFETPPIPTLEEYLRATNRCPTHHEPVRERAGCPVAGCHFGRRAA